MDSLPPMPTTNNTSNTVTRLEVPHTPLLPPPSLSLRRTWPERVVGASLDVWSMFPTQMQIDAVTSLVDVDVCGGKLLLIVKTGAGKSHVMRTTGVLLGGVCLIIMPLLALRSDQVSKLTSASQAFGPVEYFHLDEYQTRPKNMLSVLNHVASLSTTTRSTLIQNDARVRNCLIEAHSKDSFFSYLFPRSNVRVHPCFCVMSATFTKKHVTNLEKLLGFSVPPTGVRWGLPDDFCRRDVEIRFSISDDFTTTSLTPFFKDIVAD
eukprot:scaffold10460_cov29-Attheya_sp.AAC.2